VSQGGLAGHERTVYGYLLMPRLRALLAILLALTWCSAAWHVDLEAVGLMLEHEHHAHHDHDMDHAPTGMPHDDHEQVFAREVAKDQIRMGATGVLWFAIVGVYLSCGLNPGDRCGEPEPVPIRGRTAPPEQRVWQFVQRCAPESAAPPALA
jgi:hypothetical protein